MFQVLTVAIFLLFTSLSFATSKSSKTNEKIIVETSDEDVFKNENWQNFVTNLKKYKGTACVFSPDEKLVHGYSEEQEVPLASVTKVATAYFALETLGENYKPKTYIHLENNNLVILGEFDPYLTSDEISLMADTLSKVLTSLYFVKIDTIKIIQNQTYYGNKLRESLVPNDDLVYYNALSQPVQTNFNTVRFYKRGKNIALMQTKDGGESVVLDKELASYLSRYGRGSYNINLNSYPRIKVHFGDVLNTFLAQKGFKAVVVSESKVRPANLNLVLTYENSKTLREMCALLLETSNNVAANSIGLMAAFRNGTDEITFPGKKISEFWGKNDVSVNLYDGSGIAMENKASAKSVCQILTHFKKYKDLLSTNHFGIPAKTGTLASDGVITLAGFLPDGEIFFFYLPQRFGSRLRRNMLGILRRNIK